MHYTLFPCPSFHIFGCGLEAPRRSSATSAGISGIGFAFVGTSTGCVGGCDGVLLFITSGTFDSSGIIVFGSIPEARTSSLISGVVFAHGIGIST